MTIFVISCNFPQDINSSLGLTMEDALRCTSKISIKLLMFQNAIKVSQIHKIYMSPSSLSVGDHRQASEQRHGICQRSQHQSSQSLLRHGKTHRKHCQTQSFHQCWWPDWELLDSQDCLWLLVKGSNSPLRGCVSGSLSTFQVYSPKNILETIHYVQIL